MSWKLNIYKSDITKKIFSGEINAFNLQNLQNDMLTNTSMMDFKLTETKEFTSKEEAMKVVDDQLSQMAMITKIDINFLRQSVQVIDADKVVNFYNFFDMDLYKKMFGMFNMHANNSAPKSEEDKNSISDNKKNNSNNNNYN